MMIGLATISVNSMSQVTPRPFLKCFTGVGLTVALVLVYCRSFDHPFVNFDDQEYVTENGHIRLGLTAAGVKWAFTSFECANWHPLTWLSLQMDYELFGVPERGFNGYHVTNLL